MAFTAAGIILAGGRSRRMGREKALLPLPDHPSEGVQRQSTFVAHLAGVLRPVCAEVVLVARDKEQATTFAPSISGISIVTDHLPDHGPLMGLYCGLSAIHTTHALVTAVDMPSIQPPLLLYLLDQARLAENALIVPVVQAIPQVLLAVYPRSTLPLIKLLLDEGRHSPRSLLSTAPEIRYIEEAQLREIDPQLRSFVNVNTPQELADLS